MRTRSAWLAAVVVMGAGAFMLPRASAQPQSSQLTEDQKAGAQADIVHKKAQLDEYHKGKMSMRDGY